MLAGDSVAVGAPVPGWSAVDGPQLTPGDLAVSATRTFGAADRRVAVHPAMGTAPHRVPPGHSALDGGAGAGSLRMSRLAHIDQSTGLPVRKSMPIRYEVAAPGELVHMDIKKQGRIPDGGGWRVHGRGSAQDRRCGVVRTREARDGAAAGRGYRYLHHAVDDYSRVAYSEILDDERKDTAAGFWLRANSFFASLSVTVTAVMTDNGSCYRSHTFRRRVARGGH